MSCYEAERKSPSVVDVLFLQRMEKGLEEPTLLQDDPREVRVQLYRCVVKNYFANGAGFVHDIFFQGVRVNSTDDIAGFGGRSLRS